MPTELPDNLKDLAAESHLIAQLHHPNILDVYAAGTCGAVCYFAMEYVDGTTARDHAFASLAAVAAFGADLRRYCAHEPLAARPPSALRRLALWARRNPPAAIGAAAALVLAFGLFAALAVGYVRTSAALAQVEAEATNTANALIAALTATDEDRAAPDKRLAKLRRARETVERLRTRFPANEEMAHALKRLARAIEFTARRGRRSFSRASRAFPTP